MDAASAIPVAQVDAPGGPFHAVDLPRMAARHRVALGAMPYVLRVLLENLCRHALWSGGKSVSMREIEGLLRWRDTVGAELPLHVGRVILPDSSGVPVLQDLAALRDAVARAGGDPAGVDAGLPVHLVVDHSVSVDAWGRAGALDANLRREFERNAERYAFLKWARQAFGRLHVFPPGSGIIHQLNLESVAEVAATAVHEGRSWIYPDFVLGGDSHTPMVNALGVLGWGVGGIDAEAALLGRACTFPTPEVVGVRLCGRLPAGAFTTDLALRLVEVLRRERVVNAAVEFFGPAVPVLSVAERATLSNMAPEYGATCAFFPVDDQSLRYLRLTGRDAEHVARVEAFHRRCGLFRDDADDARTAYARVIEIDLASARPSVAGPGRPQDRMDLEAVAAHFRRDVAPQGQATAGRALPGDGAVVIAAITSCTNTSNPEVMVAAGLVARNAAARGMRPPPWVKASLSPGSRAVTRYLEAAGLLAPLADIGFHVVGYGCGTCVGNSGPLADAVAADLEDGRSIGVAVLSGNRNFEGRIHPLVRASYLAAPPLVVLYALAGRIDVDLCREPLGVDAAGRPVRMEDLMPGADEIAASMAASSDPAMYQDHGDAPGAAFWEALDAPAGPRFAWNATSSHLIEPPFFSAAAASSGLPETISGARCLAMFADSLTTDHISPGGEIPPGTPAGRYLESLGVRARDFGSYVGRRGNHHVMVRGTFANIRLRNAMVPGVEGGRTRHQPGGEEMTIFEAAERYRQSGDACVVLAGKDYGSGSSRDWAAKGTALLGIVAVIAESFERIHRANLVGMGVVPLQFAPGVGWRTLGLTGEETFDVPSLRERIAAGAAVEVIATRRSGERVSFDAMPQVLTAAERQMMLDGGMMRGVLAQALKAPSPARGRGLG